jgi:hypothetical protein
VVGGDLVVDATGRGSRTPIWLEALGYPRPDKEQVRIGLGYATRTYRERPDTLGGDLAILQAATPASTDRGPPGAGGRPVAVDAGRHPG